MGTLNILFIGESYMAAHTYFRGSNYITLPEYSNTGAVFAQMLREQGFAVTHLPTHEYTERCGGRYYAGPAACGAGYTSDKLYCEPRRFVLNSMAYMKTIIL